ncbi:MraY family glycosyltransferase [Streptomyces sp. NPDC049097]|uniref:MraY family glycosyltransferase n=1 Tax=unclassified Streptomyces TaxID=2593676 RepID=UPI003435B156
MGAAVVTTSAGCAALVLGLLLTEPLRRFALRHGITDRPSLRKAHTCPTPYLGGVAVGAATLAASAIAVLPRGVFDPVLGIVLGCSALMCVLGLIDDLRQLSVRFRLCVETSAAAVVVLAGGCPTILGGPFDAVFAVVWIVFVTNAFNLLDNMDGAASSLCVVIGVFLCTTALTGGQIGLAVLTAALVGACLGFLFHNRHPARIFLGDAGSLFLGFMLASVMTVVHHDVDGLSGPAVLLLPTLVPALDTTLVMLSRYMEARPLLQGGTDHISHRLRRLGLTVPQVVRVMGAFAMAGCLAATLVAHGVLAPGVALVAACAVGVGAVRLLLVIPATAGASPIVSASRIPRTASQSRPAGGGFGRRHRPLRPTAVPHSRGARNPATLPRTAGTPAAPQ